MGTKKNTAKKSTKKTTKSPKKSSSSKSKAVEETLQPKMGIADYNKNEYSKKSISEKIDQMVRSRVRQEVIDTKLNIMGETVYGNEAKRKIAVNKMNSFFIF